MNFRGAGLVAVLAVLSGCLVPVEVGGNDAGGTCGPSNCDGCCDSSGVCGECGTPIPCTLPTAIDFGAVGRGDSLDRTVVLSNPSAHSVTATVGAPASPSGNEWAFELDTGQWVILPGASRTVIISFRPTEVRSYAASVKMRVSEGCPDQVIQLAGQGVDSVLTWAPQPLTFGYVPIGLERVETLTFTNAGSTAVQVSNLATSNSEFRIITPQPIVVPPMGTATVGIGARPALAGARAGRLDFETDLAKLQSGIAPFVVFGGGPDIDAAPVNFGTVASFANSTLPPTYSAQLKIRNVGALPVPSDPKGNLHLGGTYWTVRVKQGVPGNTAQLDELCVGIPMSGFCTNVLSPGSYDPSIGIEAVVGAALDVPVHLIPGSPGTKDWEIVIFSDDLDEPQFVVGVHAEVIVAPICQYEVSATQWNFGLVQVGSTHEVDIKITNKGQTAGAICLLSNLSLSAGAHAAYSLVGGPIASATILPGASRSVTVRLAPTGTTPTSITNLAAALAFSISSPGPQVSIPLTAALGPSCLSITPDRFNFGTVQRTCNSATKTFAIYSTCVAPVQVTSTLLNQSGSELVAVNTAGLAAGTMIASGAAPTTFSLKYSPIDDGLDVGAFVIKVVQDGASVDYVIPLAGTGDNQGLNVDTVVVNANPKTDILLVIDNSGSMADKQLNLSMGFLSLMSYATANAIDFQLAVTTSDMSVEGGRILGSAGVPKILTGTTPDLENKFKAKVNVGINGSAVEMVLAPALAAVTAPLVNSDNLGFVRPGASLAILSVSDADDQSPQPVSYYVNQLLNVKPAGQVSLSAIGPLQSIAPVGCTYDGQGGAARTLAAVTPLQGATGEICTPNWNSTLSAISQKVFGLSSFQFVLSSVPDLTGTKTITIRINGVVTPMTTTGGATVWSYDSTSNQIVFESLYTPDPGKTVTATYYVPCIP